jgi:hypothetical protein
MIFKMINVTNACLILISILILLYVNYVIVGKETYIDYNSYITIPTSAYDKAFAGGGKKYFVEFEDKFFKDALDKSIYNQAFNYEGFIEIKEYNADDMKRKVSSTIEGILNKALLIEDNSLFNVVDIKFTKVMRLGMEAKYIVSATSLIHRLNKAYGLSLATTTYHEPGSSALIEYKILGFVFEDKLNTNIVEPANLNSVAELSYDDLMKATIIKDKQYEHDTFCKYVSDLKKYRNIDYPEETGC